MGYLHAVEKDSVFNFGGVSHHAIIPYQRVATDKRALSNFRAFAQNTIFADIRRPRNFYAFMRPDFGKDLIVIFGQVYG